MCWICQGHYATEQSNLHAPRGCSPGEARHQLGSVGSYDQCGQTTGSCKLQLLIRWQMLNIMKNNNEEKTGLEAAKGHREAVKTRRRLNS